MLDYLEFPILLWFQQIKIIQTKKLMQRYDKYNI